MTSAKTKRNARNVTTTFCFISKNDHRHFYTIKILLK